MHDFVEESFKIENTFEYILSIQVSLNGFSFSVVRASDNKVLVFKCAVLQISSNKLISRRLKEWFKSDIILQAPFLQTKIIVFSDKFSLVPIALHKNELNEELAHILFEESTKLEFAENLIEKINAKLLFTLPDGLKEVVSETFGEYEISHPIKSIINNIPESTEKNSLVLLFSGNHLFLVLSKNEKLMMANSFKINHVNDVLYFVLTTLKQLEVDAKNTKLFYAGKSQYAIGITNSMVKYVDSVEMFLPNGVADKVGLSEKLIAENITLYI